MLKERNEKYNVLYCIHVIISCDFIAVKILFQKCCKSVLLKCYTDKRSSNTIINDALWFRHGHLLYHNVSTHTSKIMKHFLCQRKFFLYVPYLSSCFFPKTSWKKDEALHLKKKSPLLKDVSIKLMKLVHGLWRFLKYRQCIFAILLKSSCGKRRSLSFEQNWIPFTFVPSLVKIGTTTTDKWQISIRKLTCSVMYL